MRIIDCSSQAGTDDERFGSHGFNATPLVRHAATAAILRLAPGGAIGRHPAVGHQVFAVIDGSGTVNGEDGVEVAIQAGQAVVWAPNESHETRSETGLTAVVTEGPDLLLLLPLDLDH